MTYSNVLLQETRDGLPIILTVPHVAGLRPIVGAYVKGELFGEKQPIPHVGIVKEVIKI